MKAAHKSIYDFVVGYILDHKYPPTTREIAKATNYALSYVHGQLQEMFDLGIFETDSGANRARAIRVPELLIVRRKLTEHGVFGILENEN